MLLAIHVVAYLESPHYDINELSINIINQPRITIHICVCNIIIYNTLILLIHVSMAGHYYDNWTGPNNITYTVIHAHVIIAYTTLQLRVNYVHLVFYVRF